MLDCYKVINSLVEKQEGKMKFKNYLERSENVLTLSPLSPQLSDSPGDL